MSFLSYSVGRPQQGDHSAGFGAPVIAHGGHNVDRPQPVHKFLELLEAGVLGVGHTVEDEAALLPPAPAGPTPACTNKYFNG